MRFLRPARMEKTSNSEFASYAYELWLMLSFASLECYHQRWASFRLDSLKDLINLAAMMNTKNSTIYIFRKANIGMAAYISRNRLLTMIRWGSLHHTLFPNSYSRKEQTYKNAVVQHLDTLSVLQASFVQCHNRYHSYSPIYLTSTSSCLNAFRTLYLSPYQQHPHQCKPKWLRLASAH